MDTGALNLSAGDFTAIGKIHARIDAVIRARGKSYANSRRILRLERAGDELLAEMEGTFIYTTVLHLESAKAFCTCPAPKPCKHIAGLCTYLMTRQNEQHLFPDAPALIDETVQLALLFDRDGFVELAATTGPGKVYPLNALFVHRLTDEHRALLHRMRDSGRFGRQHANEIFVELLNQDEKATRPQFYFPGEPFARKFGGFAESRYELTELTDSETREQNFRRAGYDLVLFQVKAATGTPRPEFAGLVNFSERSNEKIFQIPSGLRDHIHEGQWQLQELMQHKILATLVPDHYRHLWENRATVGPRLVLSLYAAESKAGKFAAEAEFAVGYALAEEDFSASGSTGLNPIYTFIVTRYQALEQISHISSDDEGEEEMTVLHKTGRLIGRNLISEADLVVNQGARRDLYFGRCKVPRTRFIEFFEKIIPRERKRGVIVRIHDNIAGVFAVKTARIDIKGSSEIDWFDAAIQVEGLDAAAMREVVRAYRKKQALVELTDGRWISIEGSGVGDVMRSLENLGLKAGADGRLKKISTAELVALSQDKEAQIRTEKGAATAVQKFKNFVRADLREVDPPENFSATLRPYQKEGLAFLMKLYAAHMGGILADDMGLGKTVQAIAAVSTVAAQKRNAKFLIVCPLAAMGVWEHEFTRFAPHLKIYRSHGAGRDAGAALQADVIVTSFATFTLDAEKFSERKFEFAVIDEAQFIKNRRSLAAGAIRKINARSVFCLTGTPLENHLEDLWALFDVIYPGYMGTIQGFKLAHGKRENAQGLEKLKLKIKPFMLRRLKGEVLKDLPEKTESVVYVPMAAEQAKVYEAARQKALRQMRELSEGQSALFEMLRHLTNLRRISCHPYLEEKDSDPMLSGKLAYLDDKLDEFLESASGVLIFSQFTSVLAIVKMLLQKRRVAFFYLDGATPEKARRQLVEKFQAGENKFFLISLKAGGTALTLTRADTVIHLDPWWNPAVENQASDRAHRIGQKRHVFVYKLVSEKTVEEKVLLLQQKKRELFEALMSEAGTVSSMSREDIEYLLD